MYPPREGALRWRGVPRQDVAREAHGGVKSQLASASDRSRVKQRIHPTTAHFTSTVHPHRCPHHYPRPLQNGAPSTHTRPPEPGAGRTPPEGVQRVAARNSPPSPSPPRQSPPYCWAKSSPGGSKTGTDHGNTKRKAKTKGCSENASKHHHQPQHVSSCSFRMYTPTPATAAPPSRLPSARHAACRRARTCCVST